jgi:uncharacterized cofD-like protein
MKNIVIIGGGTGTSTLLKGFKNLSANLSVIVSSWDDGGSNGRLRKELKAFPYSDVRQCLVALATNKDWKSFFEYRYSKGKFSGHTAANLFMAQLQKSTKSVQEPIEIAKKILGVSAQITPATLTPSVLEAVLEDGRKIVSEHVIDSPRKGKGSPIRKLNLKKGILNPLAIKMIKNADVLVFGPGDLYTSVLPNLLAPGVLNAVKRSLAKKVLVTNIMTKTGQTDGFKASNFIKEFTKYAGKKTLDIAIVNSGKPNTKVLETYKKDKAVFVEQDINDNELLGTKIIVKPLLSEAIYKKSKGDKLFRSIIRHDSKKTAKIIMELI